MIDGIQSGLAESLVLSYLVHEVEKARLHFVSLDFSDVAFFFCNHVQRINQIKNILSFNSLITSLLINKGARS